MVRRTKEEAQKTRDEILTAASKVFCDNGFANSSLEDIAGEANVTRGAIYWHFKNKNDIFEALHDQLRCPLVELLLRELEEDHPDPISQLQENCTKLLIELSEDAHQRRILTLFMKKSDYHGDLECCKISHAEKKAEHLNALKAYFEMAKSNSAHLKEFDSEALAQSISCFMKGVIMDFLENPETMNVRKRVPILMDIFFRGLKS